MSPLLINEPPLQVLPSLAVAIGLNEAIVLQQIHYWTLRVPLYEDGEAWVYNTVEQWQEQFPFWSTDTIGRTLKSLRERGVVVAERRTANTFDKTLKYRIDRQVLDSLHTRNLRVSIPQPAARLPQPAAIDGGKLPASKDATCGSLCTETTQETTAETTAAAAAPAPTAKPKKSAKPEVRPLTAQDLIADGISEEVAVEFIAHRSRVKAPLTPLSWKGLKREAGKVAHMGMTLDDVLAKCVERKWQAFEADWVLNGKQPARGAAVAPRGQDTTQAAMRKFGISGGDVSDGDVFDMEG